MGQLPAKHDEIFVTFSFYPYLNPTLTNLYNHA